MNTSHKPGAATQQLIQESSKIKALRQIVAEHQYATVGGSMVDVQTAQAILLVYDAISVENKKRYRAMSTRSMAKIAWGLVK